MANNYQVKSNFIKLEEACTKWFAERALQAANEVANQLKDDLSRKQYPPASHKGQYPAQRTGNLANEVVVVPRTVATIRKTLSVGVTWTRKAFYGPILVARGRKGPADVFRKMLSRIRSIMAGTNRK